MIHSEVDALAGDRNSMRKGKRIDTAGSHVLVGFSRSLLPVHT